jgi:hypothetical protein
MTACRFEKATGTHGMSSNLFPASGVFAGVMDASAMMLPVIDVF